MKESIFPQGGKMDAIKIASVRAWAVLFMLAFFSSYAAGTLRAATEDNFSGRVVYVDLSKGFVVIDVGREQGVKNNAFFDVYRQGEKVGLIQAVKVRKKFSAADIKSTYQDNLIKNGDIVQLPMPEISVELQEQREILEDQLSPIFALAEKYYQEGEYLQAEDKINEIFELDPANERAVEMLSRIREAFLQERLAPHFAEAQGYYDEMKYKQTEAKLKEILEIDPDNQEAQMMLKNVREDMKMEKAGLEAKTVKIDINASRDAILNMTIDVFREYGCLITSSDPVAYNLEANRYIELPVLKQVLTEYGPQIENKIYYSVEIQTLPATQEACSRLVIYLRGTYDGQGRSRRHEIKRDSSVYKETEKMAFTIKNLAEKL